MADEIDDLAGVEAFAPRSPGDPEDPFVTAFAEARRGAPRGGGGGGSTLAGAVLVVAVIVLLFGVVSVALGIPDDGGDAEDVHSDEVAASLDQTTTTQVRTSTSTTTVATTSTSVGLTPGTGVATTSTTATGGHTTITTVRTSTTLPRATTTTELVNRDLEIEVTLSAAEPAVNQAVTITITMSDPDAVPTGNCQVIRIDGEVLFPDDPCDDGCDVDGAGAEPNGGTRELQIGHVFTAEGPHTIEVTGHSGDPECDNPYASVTTASFPVNVRPAS